MTKVKMGVTVVLLLLVVVFVIQNATIVELKFWLWTAEVPRSLLIFLTLVIGFVIGWFMNPFMHRGRAD